MGYGVEGEISPEHAGMWGMGFRGYDVKGSKFWVKVSDLGGWVMGWWWGLAPVGGARQHAGADEGVGAKEPCQPALLKNPVTEPY